MEEKKLGIITGFINSFSPSSYGKIVKQKFGRSFLYLSILILVISVLLSVKFTSTLAQLSGEFVDKAGEEISEIRITNGVVSVPVDQPYIYKVENYAFIIDTTGEVVSLDDYEAGLLLTKNALLSKNNARTQSYDLSQVASLYITPELLKEWMKKSGKVVFPIIMVLLVISFLIAKFIQIFLFSLISMLANNLKKKNLSYSQLLNIGLYALTLPTVLAVIVILFNFGFPLFSLIYSLLYILILVTAIGKVPAQGETQ